MPLLERGFKTWAERFSLSLRKEMGLTGTEPLNPRALARFVGARILTPDQIPGLSTAATRQLLETDPEGWSAITVAIDGSPLIVYNSRHSVGRQASDIAHEVAHLLLDHDPGKMVLSQDGGMVMRSFNEKQEEEANWLAWCLLLPREALMFAIRKRLTIEDIALQFGVSKTLVNYRLRITGVRTHIQRASSY